MADAAELSTRELYERTAALEPDLWERRLYFALSTRLLRRVARTGITPDDITAVSLVLGFVAALLLFLARLLSPPSDVMLALLGVLVLNLSNVCDALDGQLARLRGQFSPLGWLWDVLVDQVKILAVTFALILASPNSLTVLLGWMFLVMLAIKHFLHYFLEHNGPAKLWNFHPESEESEKAELFYETCMTVDRALRRMKLGLLTNGEYYLIISCGVLANFVTDGAITLALAVLLLYALAGLIFTVAFWAARLSYLQPRLSHLRQSGASFYICGADAAGKAVLHRLRREGLEAKLFIDGNPALSGTSVEGVPVMHPTELKAELPVDRVILVAAPARHALRRQLRGLGFPDRNLIVL